MDVFWMKRRVNMQQKTIIGIVLHILQIKGASWAKVNINDTKRAIEKWHYLRWTKDAWKYQKIGTTGL